MQTIGAGGNSEFIPMPVVRKRLGNPQTRTLMEWLDAFDIPVTEFSRKTKGLMLPNRCRFHGLRKAAARRLAEAGCTPHEIAAITGHASLKEVSRYTEAVNRAGLAVTAMDKIKARTGSGSQ